MKIPFLQTGFALAILMLFCAAPLFSQTSDPRWDDHFSTYGVEGEVLAVLQGKNEEMYIAGTFDLAGGLPVYGIARWDGLRWTALGQGLGFGTSGVIYTMAGDKEGNVYVGGDFDGVIQADGAVVEVNNVARWNGFSWEALGSGVNGTVRAIEVGENGVVYLGGAFTRDGSEEFELSKVAMWEDGVLNGLDNGLGTFSSVQVQALAFDSEGMLYAGGSGLTGGIFRWDGQGWETIGAEPDGAVFALAFDADDLLYVGGDFQRVAQPGASFLQANRVAAWDGTVWQALGEGFDREVRDLQVDDAGVLYAAGPFVGSGSLEIPHVARWDGAWSAVGASIGGEVGESINALAITPDGRVYAGGYVRYFNGNLANGIAFWEGGAWQPVGGGIGLNGDVYAITADGAGGFYAGGAFSYAGDVPAANVARWTDGAWQTLGQGVEGGSVYALAVGSDGSLYVAGDFENALQSDGTAVLAYGMARWDGAAWSAIGTGFNGTVESLLLDDAGVLYAGGAFTKDGSEQTTLAYLAIWNGVEWTSPGNGVAGPVNALALTEDGTLLAGGAFTSAGNTENTSFLAAWDGFDWSPVSESTQLDGEVYTLEIDDQGAVYAGGAFTEVESGLNANYIARWDGASWSQLGQPLSNGTTDCCVYAVAFDEEGTVYVGGDFDGVRQSAGTDLEANNIAGWTNNGGWILLGEGVNDAVHVLEIANSDLFVGGEFLTAGPAASTHLARWGKNVSLVAIEDGAGDLPRELTITELYPNPTRGNASMTFSVKSSQHIDVDVYDALGRRVARVYSGHVQAGRSQWVSLGSDRFVPGMYFVRVMGERMAATKKLVWLE